MEAKIQITGSDPTMGYVFLFAFENEQEENTSSHVAGFDLQTFSEGQALLDSDNDQGISFGYIDELPSSKFHVKKQIMFQIIIEDGYYYLKQENFNICEGGDDLEEARFELMEYIMEDYLNWLETPAHEFSAEAKQVFQRYQEYLEYTP